MISFFLRFLSLFQKIFRFGGIHFPQMAAIVRIKLTIDDRMSKKITQTDKTVNNAILKQGLSMAFIGAFSFLALGSNISTSLLLYHTMMLLMFVLNFLSEYSQTLFDNRDNHILSRFPVDSRTVLAAKLFSIGGYIFFQALCAASVPFFVLLFRTGMGAAVSLVVATLMNTLFSLLLTNIGYMGCFRFCSEEKLCKVLSYLQIALVLLFVLLYQVILQNKQVLQTDLLSAPAWWNLLPPVWFTAFTEIVNQPVRQFLLPVILGLSIPLFSAYITFRWFAPYFQKRLGDSGDSPVLVSVRRKEKVMRLLASLFARHPMQKTGFILTWRLAAGNTKFKEATAPAIVYIVAMMLLPLLDTSSSGEGSANFGLLFPLYSTLFISLILFQNMGFNTLGTLLWAYQARPVERPGQVLLGSFKAVYLKYFLPIYSVCTGFILFISHFRYAWDALFIFSVITLVSLFSYTVSTPVFPFSRERSALENGNMFIKFLITLLACAVFGAIHFLFRSVPGSLIGGIVILWGFITWNAAHLSRIPWYKIEKSYPSE